MREKSFIIKCIRRVLIPVVYLVMCLPFVPMTALAEDEEETVTCELTVNTEYEQDVETEEASEAVFYKVAVGGEQFASDRLTIDCGDGTATYDPNTNTLTLNNAQINASGAGIWSGTDLVINVIGNNTIISRSGGIDTFDTDLTICGDGYLSIKSSSNGIDGSSEDIVITDKVNVDIVAEGFGIIHGNIIIDTDGDVCIESLYTGIHTVAQEVVISGSGNVNITSIQDNGIGVIYNGLTLANDGKLTINAYEHGIESYDDVLITGSGDISITANNDGIHFYYWSDKVLLNGTGSSISIESGDNYHAVSSGNVAGINFDKYKVVGAPDGTYVVYKDSLGETLTGYSLSLCDYIGVNIYMELSDIVLNDSDAKLVVQLPGDKYKEIPVSDAKTAVVDGKTYYVFDCRVSAKEMTDTIKTKIVLNNGREGTEYKFTVQDYAKYILKHTSEYSAELPVVKAMLNYGASAQEYFGYNTGSLANEILSEVDKKASVTPDLTAYNYESPAATERATYLGTSLLLESEVGLRCYYESSRGLAISTVSIKCNGRSIPRSRYKFGTDGDIKYIEIMGITPAEYGEKFTLKTWDLTLADVSVYGYMAKVFESAGGNNKTVELMKNLYVYGEACAQYNGKEIE